MTDSGVLQPLMAWILIVVSILLVAGITYVYTNRNLRITGLFSLLSIFTVVCIKLITVVQSRLNTLFIGAYNENHVAYVVTGPGWEILIQEWHIWILPVIFIIMLAVLIIYSFLSAKKQNPELTLFAPLNTTTRAERLNSFMALDAAHKASKEVHQKLADALLKNATHEVKLSDFTLKTQELEEKAEILQLELNAKIKENASIMAQLKRIYKKEEF